MDFCQIQKLTGVLGYNQQTTYLGAKNKLSLSEIFYSFVELSMCSEYKDSMPLAWQWYCSIQRANQGLIVGVGAILATDMISGIPLIVKAIVMHCSALFWQ